jgi:hypothetical protein
MEESKTAEAKEESVKEINDVCKDCLFWGKFKDKCWVFWEGKKFCTMKVSDSSDWDDKKNIYNINPV